MSRELRDFSLQIDEQFEVSDVDTSNFWVYIVSFFA